MFHLAGASVLGCGRVARLCWCHSRPGGQAGRFVWPLRLCRATGILNAVVCVSRHQRRLLTACGLARRHTMVVHNGVDPERLARPAPPELALPDDRRIIVQVANVMPDKDHATLIEAAGELQRRRSDFHLVLVGRGTDDRNMAAAVERAGISSCCTLAGRRDDVAGILAAADVFVLSTRGEVLPMALLEALAASLPAIVSDIPALAEVMTDEVEGLKFPVGDSTALADRLDRMLSDDQAASQMASAAGIKARAFSVARMAGRFERLLRTAGRGAEQG